LFLRESKEEIQIAPLLKLKFVWSGPVLSEVEGTPARWFWRTAGKRAKPALSEAEGSARFTRTACPSP
jgi:hypothetical protein